MSSVIDISRVAIVGAGAIGGYYGARLAEAGKDVTFLVRSDYDAIQANGISVTSVAGDFDLPHVSCVKHSEEIGVVDLVIVAWKTTSNAHLKETLSPLLHEGTLILTLQNGLGNCETLAELFGAERVFGGLCFICVNRIAPGKLRHTASGQIRVGAYLESQQEQLEALVSFLSEGGIDCRAVDCLEKAQWMKLVWNIPFNGLAISEGGVTTLQLLETPGVEERVLRLMKEVQAVARALGHEIPDDFIKKQIALTWGMKDYKPSSMIDYVAGREVEVDSIWREPYRRASELGVKVPEIKRLLDEIEKKLKKNVFFSGQ